MKSTNSSGTGFPFACGLCIVHAATLNGNATRSPFSLSFGLRVSKAAKGTYGVTCNGRSR
jgi:hypothetical protein